MKNRWETHQYSLEYIKSYKCVSFIFHQTLLSHVSYTRSTRTPLVVVVKLSFPSFFCVYTHTCAQNKSRRIGNTSKYVSKIYLKFSRNTHRTYTHIQQSTPTNNKVKCKKMLLRILKILFQSDRYIIHFVEFLCCIYALIHKIREDGIQWAGLLYYNINACTDVMYRLLLLLYSLKAK